MPIVKIAKFGGIVNDIPAHELPSNVFSDGLNIRFREGAAHKCQGYSAVFDPPTVAPYWLLPVQTEATYYWIYAGLAKVYVTEGTSHYNITRQTASVDVDYTGTATDKWTGGILNGLPFLNNGVDAPQMWSPVSTSTKLAALTAFPASTTCRALRPFKQFIVALDVTKSSTRYPHMVKWSHQADAGALPASWDETDATKDAGEYNISETPGYAIDCLPLGDTNIIYKEDSAWGMQYTGGKFVFRFYRIPNSRGILAAGCVTSYDGGHCLLSKGDVFVTDGHTFTSIVDERMRSWLFDSIDPTYYTQSFLVTNQKKSEVWICFPSVGSTLCDTALVWNWQENTFGVRELPNAAFISPGVVDPSENLTWASDTETWADDTTTWNQRSYNPSDPSALIADPTNTKLYQADVTNQKNAVNMTSYVERSGMTFDDMDSVITVRAIYPRITANNGTVVNVYVGGQMEIGDPVSYSSAKTFTVGTDYKVDCLETYRLPAVKFETTSDVAWKMNGYDIDIEYAGRR